MAARRQTAGFTYLGVLLLVALLGAFLGAIGEVWRTTQLREAERDLRFIGEEFRRAIGRYYESTPGPAKMYPQRLEHLLSDNRYPGARRYLRRIYRDPITLRREWGVVETPEGGIVGVYSLSEAEPLGRQDPSAGDGRTESAGVAAADAPKKDEEERRPRYSDWKFVYTPAQPSPPPPPGSPAGGAPTPGGAPPPAAPPR